MPDQQIGLMEAEPPSEQANDPASLLRAAALLTLKSKRGKPATSRSLPSLPSRPIPVDNSVQLDYGQEDSIASSPPQPSVNVDIENAQTREEGEISDSEDPPAKPTLSPTTPSSIRPQAVSSSQNNSMLPPRQGISLKVESPPPTLLVRISDSSARPGPSSASTLTDEFNFGQRSYFVDPNHVRPGLEMNQEQYDTAKDIVLDLLGWGVPPEYLLDCGLSREIVYYVFNELHLRLPENLDKTGLVPYNPSTATSLLRDPKASPSAPSNTSNSRSMGHPSLPPKPGSVSVNQNQMQQRPPPSDASQLNDMERQRREELLARKAVMSSRKGKTPASTLPSVATNDQDVEMTSLVPTETVDDFLKSIGSGEGEVRDDHDRMDVDQDDIPGLGRPSSRSHSSPSSTPILPLPSIVEDISMEVDHQPQPPSATETIDSPTSRSDPPSRRSSASASTPTEDQNQANANTSSRKAAKRPVAADFVDFETEAEAESDLVSRHRLGVNDNGGSTESIHPHLKRKLGGSFASVSTMRRCVIDLSDSEGEGEGGDEGRDARRDARGSAGLPPYVRRMSVPPKVGRSMTPPNLNLVAPLSAGAVPNRLRSPNPNSNSLAEKEAEILKMRQMIAERERVKKLKRMESTGNSGTSTPDISSMLVKQEDMELGSLATASGSHDPSATIKSLSENNALDVTASDNNNNSVVPGTKNAATTATSSIGHIDTAGDASQEASGSRSPTTTRDAISEVHNDQVALAPPTDQARAQETETPAEAEAKATVDVDPASSSSAQMKSTLVTTSMTSELQPQLIRKLEESQNQNQEKHEHEEHDDLVYPVYSSVFDEYPLLRSRPRLEVVFHDYGSEQTTLSDEPIDLDSVSAPTNNTRSSSLSTVTVVSLSSPSPSPSIPSSFTIPSSSPLSSVPVIDLKPLKLARVYQSLDASKRICRYEIPGGGVCRDVKCEDFHLSGLGLENGTGLDLLGEPSDQDTAAFIARALPTSETSVYGSTSTPTSRIVAALEEIRLRNPTMTIEERVARVMTALESPSPHRSTT